MNRAVVAFQPVYEELCMGERMILPELDVLANFQVVNFLYILKELLVTIHYKLVFSCTFGPLSSLCFLEASIVPTTCTLPCHSNGHPGLTSPNCTELYPWEVLTLPGWEKGCDMAASLVHAKCIPE